MVIVDGFEFKFTLLGNIHIIMIFQAFYTSWILQAAPIGRMDIAVLDLGEVNLKTLV